MKLTDVIADDLSAILADFEQMVTVKHGSSSVKVAGALDTVSTSDAGYLAVEGEAVSATVTVARKSLPFTPAIGDTVIADGYRYAVVGMTSIPGDVAVTLNLAVEGRNA